MARFLPSQSFSAPLQIPANPIRNATWTLNSNQFRLKRLNRLQHISNSQPSRFKRARNRATTDSSCATSGSLISPNSPSHSILKSPGINKRCLSGRTIANCFSAYKKPSAITFKASRNRTTPKANGPSQKPKAPPATSGSGLKLNDMMAMAALDPNTPPPFSSKAKAPAAQKTLTDFDPDKISIRFPKVPSKLKINSPGTRSATTHNASPPSNSAPANPQVSSSSAGQEIRGNGKPNPRIAMIERMVVMGLAKRLP